MTQSAPKISEFVGQKAVFLDRDGTINIEKEYLYKFEDWEWIPGAIDAIGLLNRLGYLVIVVTNQAGVARGYYNEADILNLHARVDEELARAGAKIDAFYYCPHHPQFGLDRACSCRKPDTGMLLAAQQSFNIALHRSWIVGDKQSDIAAGMKCGVSPILVQTGYGLRESAAVSPEIPLAENLLSAVHYIAKSGAR
ncbi:MULTISPECIES: D-glycero-beta-D-manno-heptose 1,7-bisphosphate 7-phosphatase [unclassified Paludibacterium]|uniref:D-glycero-beta-D-manno-heptose 1,7-bisphosphate 7-phosphatase n=1 Tax=unclassified Paludibacterium TaxID=2618429 RepID=UPI001C05C268|nr:D-glycero-beta-D-manno-heptose 1,7-bisphosphate 7-phosphatase [Paludibacterium sp. B53371]BEV73305.1 D-glycero-beta-D-manno-heptose 1,7-bisphosphate 7-phosphatase [Paludibacterium sp. THUN1379]